jgi:hypothetical protein
MRPWAFSQDANACTLFRYAPIFPGETKAEAFRRQGITGDDYVVLLRWSRLHDGVTYYSAGAHADDDPERSAAAET